MCVVGVVDIAFIALLVGAVGIINTLYTSVNERIKEIGTMKAIGAKNRFVLSLFLSEALLIGLLGSSLGISMGITGAYILTSSLVGSIPGGDQLKQHRLISLPYSCQMTFLMSGFSRYS